MKQIFDLEISKIKNQMVNAPWEDARYYASYLSQTYHFVRHSTRLLALSSAHAKLDQTALHRRFGAHIGEEKGHDLLALADIQRLGFGSPDRELPETRNLYEVQYY